MIWSVSTLLRRNGSAVPVCSVNFSIASLSSVSVSRETLRGCSTRSAGHAFWDVVASGQRRQVGRRGQPTGDRRGSGDQRRHQVGAATLALTSFEVAVRRRGTPLAGLELVGVHA